MKDQHVEIACIVDRSGSMQSIASDAVGGFNTFLEGQKSEPGDVRFTLVLFDHEYDVVHNAVDIRNVPPLDAATYRPRGTTALLDAVGRTIDDVGNRLASHPERERPGAVIIAILTDGLENASRDYDYEKVSKMISHQKEKYAWEFVFLAANQDAISNAARMSIGAQDAYSFNADAAGVRSAYVAMDDAVRRKRELRS